MNTSVSIHSSSVVDEDVFFGNGTEIWHFCHISKGAKIGSNCRLGQNVFIGEGVIIGNGCKLQNNVSVYSGVTIEDEVFCGPSCVFTNDLTPRAKFPKGSANYVKTLVKTGASIGANATIVCDTTIGQSAMIGAGAVVTKDVPDYALMLGVPAKFAGYVCKCGSRLSDKFECNVCGRTYHTEGGGLKCNSEI
ncbi:MAG: N-acetyltransferase [Prevotellaceae bacterium]|jgi:UDP-2-acetamido-3-amino-2,3-dideoxy-glucuronate N-acetyltransferase|nr:N-acetyltransferase [Prevotellaceae bacterium]